MHIGVVEDNPAVLSMVETALALHGHSVETYSDRSSFLSALQRAGHIPPFDLVLVDLFLDQGSGIELIEVLRLVQPRAVPAILISAAEGTILAPIRKRYPDLPILQKPFKVQELVSLIDKTTSR